MKRRCDRAGVVWPRLTPFDALTGNALGSLDVLARFAHERRTLSFNQGNHARMMAHLREHPVLPPWWTQEMLDRVHARAAGWAEMLRDLHPLPPPVCPSPTEV